MLHEIFHPDFGRAKHDGDALCGPARAHHALEYMLQAFPDLRFTVLDMTAEDDRVVVHVRLTGTHEGMFMGIPPTGKRVEFEGAEMAILQDGQIVKEGWHFDDVTGLLRQIGIL